MIKDIMNILEQVLRHGKDYFRIWLGDPKTRIPRGLIAAGISGVASTWWLPILYSHLVDSSLVNPDYLLQAERTAYVTGWVLIVLGIGLWLRMSDAKATSSRTQPTAPPTSEKAKRSRWWEVPIARWGFQAGILVVCLVSAKLAWPEPALPLSIRVSRMIVGELGGSVGVAAQTGEIDMISRADLLPVNPIPIAVVDLNSASDLDDQRCSKLLAILAQIPTVRDLYLASPKLTDTSLRDLNKVRSLNKVSLHHTNPGKVTFRALSELESLMSLTLNNTQTSDDELPIIANCVHLRELWLSNTRVSSEGMASIGKMRDLRLLALSNNEAIGDDGLDALPLESLMLLDISFCRITGGSLKHLKRCGEINQLFLNGLPIEDKDLNVIHDEHAIVWPHLRKLALKETRISDASLDLLASFSKLQEIWLTDSNVTAEGAARLETLCPELKIHY